VKEDLFVAAHTAAWRLQRSAEAALKAACAAGLKPGSVEAVKTAVAEYVGGLDVLASVIDASGTGGLLPPPSARRLRRAATETRLNDWVKEGDRKG
jgi:hypothetical protein